MFKVIILFQGIFDQFRMLLLIHLFVNIPLTTPRINFRISECHHRFSIDLIVIFSAKNGKLFLDHTDPLTVLLKS